MTYVDEDDRFRMRSLNRMFHSFYYRITEVRNSDRVLFLSKTRQFPRVTALEIDVDKIPRDTLSLVSPKRFPRLLSVSLSCSQRVTYSDLESLNHPGIQELKADLSQPNDISAITELKFPELTTLNISIRGLICVEPPYQPFRLKPHKKLKKVTMDHLFLDDSFFNTLNLEHFPQLRVVSVSEDSCLFVNISSEELKQKFEQSNIKFEFLSKAGDLKNLERLYTRN